MVYGPFQKKSLNHLFVQFPCQPTVSLAYGVLVAKAARLEAAALQVGKRQNLKVYGGGIGSSQSCYCLMIVT